MKKCCFIVPYFGKFPVYFQLFLNSCAYNENFNWLFITDIKDTYDYPSNVRVINMTFEELKVFFQNKFDFKIALDKPYKLCDYKPSYGYVFEEYLSEYLFWGHCDIDTLMGNLSHFVTDKLLNNFDKLFCLGHMVLYRNTYENNRVFMSKYKGKYLYKEVFSTDRICWFDEEYADDNNINRIFLSLNKKVFQSDYSLNIRTLPTRFVRSQYLGISIYPYNHGYKVENYKEAIYVWDHGSLFRFYIYNNKLVKEEFSYVHFLHRKMSISKSLKKIDIFKIIPNKITSLEVDTITLNNFHKVKKIGINAHLWNVIILPKIKKILKMCKFKM